MSTGTSTPATLAEQPHPSQTSQGAPQLAPIVTSSENAPSPTHLTRQHHTLAGTLDREGEDAEREMADYGGDYPGAPPVKGESDETTFSRSRSKSKSGRVMTPTSPTSPTMGRKLSRTASGLVTGMEFPPLHLMDSAFEDAHRTLSRQSQRAEAETSGDGLDGRKGDGTASEGTTARGESEAGDEPKIDPNRVQWDENDPENPQNWSYRYKWVITALCSLLTVNVTFASTAPSSATLAFAADFNTTVEISLLATSLFLFGYCTGPLLWAPASEMVGRRSVFIVTMLVYTLFQIGDALAQNITTLLVIRFIAGTFAAAPLTNAGGVIADTWDAIGRGPAMSVFSASVFIGPVIGPIVGGYLTESFLTWRWIFWIQALFGLFCWVMVVAFLPETYAPFLLAQRARKMRKDDPIGNKDKWADLERADFSFKGIITRTMARPWIMLAKEPILVLVTIYMSLIYGLLYALFSIVPIIWIDLRGFGNGESGLIFLFVGVGTTIGAVFNIWLGRGYKDLVPKWHGHPPPEQRLWGAMLAGPPLIIGCFFVGWTGVFANIPWWVPGLAMVVLGTSFTLVFISFLTYIIEVYLMYSASALASNTIIRSAVGGAFPLFTDKFFGSAIGIGGACSVIGAIGVLISPVPVIFYFYGARIRQGSTFAPCLDLHMRERVEREELEALEKLTGEKTPATV